ncbi:unnamed protein product (macronuclear) [Paramecium tetraurelia]|uniref:Transmembrane protein n=1 Tax=Paramecium tetraurelia TaxID=5888 RepID=A0BEC2_PARTE|nr:uncharacterized protein GSPATT00027922001 [Paramecium tetraurelia]CAK56889.1 unnamed protein product [Paramecium tetraurelia]|eukprot:XP_001424287.1 hypothetical protein (macronuclear) [Paramecium tetraurelia strain d4-2]
MKCSQVEQLGIFKSDTYYAQGCTNLKGKCILSQICQQQRYNLMQFLTTFDNKCTDYIMNKQACLLNIRGHKCFFDPNQYPENKCQEYKEEQIVCSSLTQINIEICMNYYYIMFLQRIFLRLQIDQGLPCLWLNGACQLFQAVSPDTCSKAGDQRSKNVCLSISGKDNFVNIKILILQHKGNYKAENCLNNINKLQCNFLINQFLHTQNTVQKEFQQVWISFRSYKNLKLPTLMIAIQLLVINHAYQLQNMFNQIIIILSNQFLCYLNKQIIYFQCTIKYFKDYISNINLLEFGSQDLKFQECFGSNSILQIYNQNNFIGQGKPHLRIIYIFTYFSNLYFDALITLAQCCNGEVNSFFKQVISL